MKWLLLVLWLVGGCAPKPLSVDELNAREQERLARQAAREGVVLWNQATPTADGRLEVIELRKRTELAR